MIKEPWLDTHIHVSDIGPDGKYRPNLLEDILTVLDHSDADLRWVISNDGHWLSRLANETDGALEANRFIYDLVRRAPGRLYGGCMVNPRYLDTALRVMELAFGQWGFVLFGELVQYILDFRMDSQPVERLVRVAVEFNVPVQVHISTSNSAQGTFTSGVEELHDLLALTERVPEAKYILAHFVGTSKDNPPVVETYLDAIEKRCGRWPKNFWAEIRDFNSPGVRVLLTRVPHTRIIAGTDWCSRIGPPFLPYGVVFGVKSVAENPYPPSVSAMKSFLRQAGASEASIPKIAFENAAELLRLPQHKG